MREQNSQQSRKTSRDIKRSSIIFSWVRWDYLSAGYGKRQFDSADRFYHYDWRTRSYEPTIPSSWLAYHFVVIAASATTFTAGIGQFILKLWGH